MEQLKFQRSVILDELKELESQREENGKPEGLDNPADRNRKLRYNIVKQYKRKYLHK